MTLIILTSCHQKELNKNSKYVEIDFREIEVITFSEKLSKLTNSEIINDANKLILKSELIPLLNTILGNKGLILMKNAKNKYTVIGTLCKNLESKVEKLSDVKEAMYRYIFQKFNGSNMNYYFLSYKEKDETKEILERLKDTTPLALAKSMSKVSRLGENGNSFRDKTLVHHKDNGADGLAFAIDCVTQITSSKVKVVWFYYKHGLYAGEEEAILELQNKKWMVSSNRVIWVS